MVTHTDASRLLMAGRVFAPRALNKFTRDLEKLLALCYPDDTATQARMRKAIIAIARNANAWEFGYDTLEAKALRARSLAKSKRKEKKAHAPRKKPRQPADVRRWLQRHDTEVR